jgi:hypothetical protein
LADLDGFTPEEVRIKTIDFVCNGGQVKQKAESDPQWMHFRFKYEIILPPGPGFPRGIYVKVILIDDDPDDPAVQFVSAHRNGV